MNVLRCKTQRQKLKIFAIYFFFLHLYCPPNVLWCPLLVPWRAQVIYVLCFNYYSLNNSVRLNNGRFREVLCKACGMCGHALSFHGPSTRSTLSVQQFSKPIKHDVHVSTGSYQNRFAALNIYNNNKKKQRVVSSNFLFDLLQSTQVITRKDKLTRPKTTVCHIPFFSYVFRTVQCFDGSQKCARYFCLLQFIIAKLFHSHQR